MRLAIGEVDTQGRSYALFPFVRFPNIFRPSNVRFAHAPAEQLHYNLLTSHYLKERRTKRIVQHIV